MPDHARFDYLSPASGIGMSCLAVFAGVTDREFFSTGSEGGVPDSGASPADPGRASSHRGAYSFEPGLAGAAYVGAGVSVIRPSGSALVYAKNSVPSAVTPETL